MRLLLIRHAIAEEREDFARTGKDDGLRPLTDDGRKKMKQAARGLRGLVPDIDLLATSPLTRVVAFAERLVSPRSRERRSSAIDSTTTQSNQTAMLIRSHTPTHGVGRFALIRGASNEVITPAATRISMLATE